MTEKWIFPSGNIFCKLINSNTEQVLEWSLATTILVLADTSQQLEWYYPKNLENTGVWFAATVDGNETRTLSCVSVDHWRFNIGRISIDRIFGACSSYRCFSTSICQPVQYCQPILSTGWSVQDLVENWQGIACAVPLCLFQVISS